jgi:hypothetical protein
MTSAHDLYQDQRNAAGWAFDPDEVHVPDQTESQAMKDRRARSSAAKMAAQVHEGEQEHAKQRDATVDDLQQRRQARLKARRRLAGLSTAEIMSAPYTGDAS